MKQIILIDTSSKAFDETVLTRAIEHVGCEFEISKRSNSVFIEGNNDVLAAAKRAIANSGYSIL